MSEDPEYTSAEDVLPSSELAARLLRRLVASPGVIDTQRVFQTYARLTELITHARPLLHDLLSRYYIDDDSTEQNLPLVMDQPWMLNLNSYLTNNNSTSSTTTTTNNSFFASSNINQFNSQVNTSSSTHTELLGTTSQSSPPEKFRVSRSPVARRQSASVDVRETLVQAALAMPMVQRELPETEMKTSRVFIKDTVAAQESGSALGHESGSALGQSQYRNAVASGESRSSSIIDARPRPDATALRYRPLPTMTREAESKDTLRIKNEQQSVTDRSVEVRQETNTTTRTLFEKTDTAVTAATLPTLPLAQEQLPTSQFQTRPQQLVWRKSADSLTLRDLVSNVSSNSTLAAVRQAFDSLPMAEAQPSSQTYRPEPSHREDESQPAGEEITTEGMLRRISKMLLIERERRGY